MPDDLMREIKIGAAQENRRLKDAIADLLRRGLSHQKAEREVVRNRVALPLVECARDARPDREMTPERMAKVLLEEEAEAQRVSVR